MKRLIAGFAAVTLALSAAFAPALAVAGSVNLDINAQVRGSYSGSNDLGTPSLPLNLSGLVRLSPGTGSAQADLLFADERTLTASSTENLDLAGSLTDPLGATLTFAKIKAIVVIAAAGNTNNVVVGGAASNGFVGAFGDATDTIAVKPGGVLVLAHPGAGWTVTASTGDILKVANSSSGSSVTYKVILVGTSA